MSNYVKIATILLFFLSLSATSSQALITVQNVDANTVSNPVAFTQSEIDTPTGNASDFEIITCGTFSVQGNSFLAPTPDAFDPVDIGGCDGGIACIQGIWSRFVDTAASDINFCNWTTPVNVFGAGSIRWSGVDQNNPIVTAACATGFSNIATAPSANAEEGSFVVRIYTLSPSVDALVEGAAIEFGEFTAIAVLGSQELVVHGFTVPADGAGPTGTADYSIERTSSWRACTIVLRAASTNIPTLSEWGLGIFAALFGVAAVWALRRRAAKA